MKRKITIAFLCMLAVWPLAAKDASYQMHGYVRDATGQLLEGVTVLLVGRNQGTVTDSSGYYRLDLRLDTVRIRFSMTGFITQDRVVTALMARFRPRLDVVLEENVQDLADMTILGSSAESVSLQHVDVEKVRVMPSLAGNSIEGVVKTFQGVSSNNELTGQYSVRGGSYDENGVYVNGVEVYRPYLIRTGEQEGLSFVNPDMAGNVQFSAGGFEARYGDRLASVLDITYRKPRPFEAGVSASFMGASAYIGSNNGKFSQLHGFRYKNASWILGTLQTQAEYDPNFIDYQTCLSYKPVPELELGLLASFSRNKYRFVPQTRSTTFGPLGMMQNFKVYFSGSEEDVFRTVSGALSATWRPTDRVDLRFTVSSFYTDERVSYDVAGEYWLNSVSSLVETEGIVTGVGNYFEHARNRMNASVTKAAHDGTWHAGEHNRVQWGMSFEHECVNESSREWEMRDSSGYTLPYSPDRVNLYYSLVSDNQLYANRLRGYLQDRYECELPNGGVFSVTAGVRCNYWRFNDEFTLSPRLSMMFKPPLKTDVRFRLAGGLYYQSPSYKEIKDTALVNGAYVNALNSDIRSQRSAQVICGMDVFYYFLRHPFRFTVDAYYKHLSNLISYSQDNLTIRYSGVNDGHGYAAGLDMKLFGEFVEGVDSWISFSLMRTMEMNDNDGYGYTPRPMDQLYNVSVFFQDYIPGLPQYRLHVLFNWAQGMPTGPSRGDRKERSQYRMPDYRRVDIGMSRQFEKGKDPWMSRGFFKPFRKILVAFEVLNVFGFNNVNSYYWVSAFDGNQYGVPNYLTGRQFNLKLQLDF